jgi:hypothetical protein
VASLPTIIHFISPTHENLFPQNPLLLLPAFSFSQDIVNPPIVKRNTIYFEAFGQGLYNSLSFDRLYNVEKKVKTSFSSGVTIIPHPDLLVLGAPVSFNALLGKKCHYLETGIGFTVLYIRQNRISASEYFTDQGGLVRTNDFIGYSDDFFSFFTPKIGYRFQKPGGGIFFRLSFTPPVAGINRIGQVNSTDNFFCGEPPYMEYFTNAAFFDRLAVPWGGISLGWTLK